MGRAEYEDDDSTVIIERRSAGAGSFFMGLAIGAGLALRSPLPLFKKGGKKKP